MATRSTAVACLLVAAACAFPAAGLKVRSYSESFDCPLCVAEDHCHEACNEIKGENPGSKYCLMACNGAHPDDSFDATWFQRADAQMKEDEERSAHMQELGRELAEDVKRMS